MSPSLREYLSFTTELAYQAGRLTLGYFQTTLRPEIKSDGSPVTIADRKAEELIRNAIESRFPQHAIVGEEFGEASASHASHRWIIDPIDGTKSFIHGVPLYGVLIGLEIEGRVEVGAAYFPALDEMIAAATGEGCWWNGRLAHMSTVEHLEEAVVCFTELRNFSAKEREPILTRLSNRVKHAVAWSDAYGYLLVATGRAEVMLDPLMHEWDCGPFPPIFRELGGYFGDWKGNQTIYEDEALATTQPLLPEILALLNGTNPYS